VHDEDTEVLI